MGLLIGGFLANAFCQAKPPSCGDGECQRACPRVGECVRAYGHTGYHKCQYGHSY